MSKPKSAYIQQMEFNFFSKRKNAFSLVELLVVMSIVAVLAALSGPAIHALSGAGSTNKAVADLSRTLEAARIYAMANNTYVRVGFHQMDSTDSTSSTVVLPLYSVDGSATASMNTSNWRAISKPLRLENFVPDSNLDGSTPDTSTDASPFASPSLFGSLTLPIGGLSPQPFNYFLEFTPSGNARLDADVPERHIKIGLQNRRGASANSFLIRVSGMNGTMLVVREEDMH